MELEGTTTATILLMSSPRPTALQQLHRLDRSSSRFHDRLCEVLYGEEFRLCVPKLQGDDSLWLVEYLDKVRRRVALTLSTQVSVGSQ